jgi:hypothetical protein
MKKLMLAALAALILAAPSSAFAQAAPVKQDGPLQPGQQITVRDAIALLSALRNLDGRMVVVEQGGQKGTVMQPWEFKSGIVRLRIASNISILAAVEKAADDARVGIVKQVRKKYGVDQITGESPAFEEFSRLYDEVLNAKAAGTQDLARIKASDLKLDANEISVTVLSALRPILDQDVK